MSVKTSRKHAHLIQLNQRQSLTLNSEGSSASEGYEIVGNSLTPALPSRWLWIGDQYCTLVKRSVQMPVALGKGNSPRLWSRSPFLAQCSHPGTDQA